MIDKSAKLELSRLVEGKCIICGKHCKRRFVAYQVINSRTIRRNNGEIEIENDIIKELQSYKPIHAKCERQTPKE